MRSSSLHVYVEEDAVIGNYLMSYVTVMTVEKSTAPVAKDFLEKISKVKHNYCGTVDENGFRMGASCQEWLKGDIAQSYRGQFLYNNLQNKGIYLISKTGDETYYDGLFFCNKLEGYGKVFYPDCTAFEGLFKQHVRFGPGILTRPDDSQDVGVWDGFFLRKIIVAVGKDFVPRLAETSMGKARLLKYRQLVPIRAESVDLAKEILTRLNADEETMEQSSQLYNKHVRDPESLFFDEKLYRENFARDQCTIDVVISQEEFEQSVSGSQQSLENRSECCSCFQPNLDRFGHICHQLDDVEFKLEKLAKKRERIEEQVHQCQACCANICRIRAKEKENRRHMDQASSESPPDCSSISETEEVSHATATGSEIELQNYIYDLEVFDEEQNFYKKDPHVAFSKLAFEEYLGEYGLDDTVHEPQVCTCNKPHNFGHLQKKLESLKQEEMFYASVKNNLKKHLDVEFERIDRLGREGKRFVRRVVVTDLLAWNNEETWVAILQHCFRHKMSEDIVSFSVRDLLVGHRQYFKSPGVYENNCRKFLEECAEGNGKNIVNFLTKFKVHPDLCDAKGNTGLMLATIRDKNSIITTLVNCGAKLDIMNDECLTPLTISFLKYISFKLKVINWEKAFLADAKPSEIDAEQWRPAESLQSLYELYATQSVVGISQDDHIEAKNESKVKSEQKYIFDLSHARAPPQKPDQLRKGTKLRKKKTNKSSKKEAVEKTKSTHDPESNLINENIGTKLETIKETIMTLVQHRCDPNVGTVPLKPIFLAVFTDDSDFMHALLKNNADPNAVTPDDHLTSLHIIASLKLTLHRLRMCELLVHFKADANIRTSSGHWSELKREILGEAFEDLTNEGKNVLHLLSMREDYTNDSSEVLSIMVKLLVLKGCKTGDLYLGHSPLSLAVLWGNNELIEALLTTKRVDPHQVLGNEMGNALTVLVLNRYSRGLTFEDKKRVVETLLNNGLNPLNGIGTFENAIAFMEHEYHSSQLRKESRKEVKKKKKKKGKSMKSSTKSVENYSIENYIVENARKILFRHLQGKAVEHLYVLVGERFLDDPLVVVLARFVTAKEALSVINLLFQYGVLHCERFSYRAIWDLLEFVRIQGSTDEPLSERHARKMEEKLKTLSWKRVKREPESLYLPFPEVDENVDKYKVCFQCLKRENRKLLKCPSCELVYFCSEECNVLSNNTGIYHRCRTLFYDKVATIIQASEQPSRMPFILNMANAAEMRRREEGKTANSKLRSTKKLAFQDLKRGEQGVDASKSTHLMLDWEIQAEIKELENLQTKSSNGMSFHEYEAKFLQQAADDVKRTRHSRLHVEPSSNLDRKDSILCRHGSRRSTARKTSTVLFDLQPRRLSYFLTNRRYLTGGRIAQMAKKGHQEQPSTSLSLEYTKDYYMKVLAKIFSNFNLPLLLLPYACFKDGQVYYKLNGDKANSLGPGFHKLIPD